jgi:hypothetical protein
MGTSLRVNVGLVVCVAPPPCLKRTHVTMKGKIFRGIQEKVMVQPSTRVLWGCLRTIQNVRAQAELLRWG